MARSRNIKPGFFANEDLAECSFETRLCFAGLWTLADREGRMEDRPKRIKGELFRFDSVEVEPMLDELARYGFILRYEVGGQRFIQVAKFTDHQTPHYTEKPSIIPPPLQEQTQDDPPHDDGITPRADPETPGVDPASRGGRYPLIPDSLIPDSLIQRETEVVAGDTQPKTAEDPPPAAADEPAAHAKRKRKAQTGTRLPPEWTLPRTWGVWALSEFPQWTAEKVRLEGQKFADHWHAKSGADATKLDWLATWRNWCRSDIAHRDDPKPTSDAPRPANGRAAPNETTPTPPGALYTPPPPLSPEERARADARRREVMAKHGRAAA